MTSLRALSMRARGQGLPAVAVDAFGLPDAPHSLCGGRGFWRPDAGPWRCRQCEPPPREPASMVGWEWCGFPEGWSGDAA